MAIRRLTPEDIDRVVDLYNFVYPLTPVGNLSRRSRQEFASILESENVSAGVFSGDDLIGYQLWDKVNDVEHNTVRFSKVTEITRIGNVLYNKGTVIAPEWQNRGLAGLLERYTYELAQRERYRYRLAQMFIHNTPAIRLFLAVDRVLIGLSIDQSFPNFVSCTHLGGPVKLTRRGTCRIDDIDRIGEILERFVVFQTVGRRPVVDLVFGDMTLGDRRPSVKTA